MQTEIDIFADELEPVHSEWAKVYIVKIPKAMERPTAQTGTVYVEVDQYNVITLGGNSWWFGEQIGRHTAGNHDTIMEIYGWLVEWELAEWLQIGPEDRELFATDKLTDNDR